MISPEQTTMLILIMWGLNGFLYVILGAARTEKDTHYGLRNVIIGLIVILFAIYLYVV